MKRTILLALFLSLPGVFAWSQESGDSKPKEDVNEEVFGDAEEWNTDEFGKQPEFDDSKVGKESEFKEDEFEKDVTSTEKQPVKKSAPKNADKTKEDQPQDEFGEDFGEDNFDNEAGQQNAAAGDNSNAALRVIGLDFKQFASVSRVIVKANGPMEFDQETKENQKQVIVIVKNAGILPKLKRRLDTTEFASTVRYISAYPESQPYPTVRIVVQLHENVSATIHAEGNLLNIDFPTEAFRNTPTTKLGPPTTGKIGKSPVTLENQDDLQMGGSFQELLVGPEKFYGKPIPSLIVKDEDIVQVLAVIAEHSGFNIVASDDVTGKITLHLRDVPWDQALSIILKTKRLGYVRTGNVLRVSPISTFQSEKEAAAAAAEANRKLEPIRTLLIPVSYSKAADLEAQIKDFLTPVRGSVNNNKRTNTLIVRDTEDVLKRVQKLVNTLDTETPQVIIEARLVEANKSFSRNIGFSPWNVNANHGFSGQTFTGSGGNSLALPGSGNGVGGAMAFSGTSLSTTLGTKIGDTLALSATLSLSESENVIKTITSPRAITLDNEEATLRTGREETYIRSSSASTTGATTVSTSVIQINIKTETAFKVTPHITAEGSIFLDIDVNREYSFPNSASDIPDKFTRSAKTRLLVNNGETVVIGGFYNNEKSLSESGVPWLRHIPLLGFFFRGRGNTEARTELIFFITPRVLNPEKAFVSNRG
jgi:type IV pilus assembly protein PilQ